MSVHIDHIRYVEYQSVNIMFQDEDTCWTSLVGDTLPDHFRSYNLFEVLTYGWSGGARCRVKRLSAERLLPYLNKLVAGNWIDGDEYQRAYGAALQLMVKVRYTLPDHLRAWLDPFASMTSPDVSD